MINIKISVHPVSHRLEWRGWWGHFQDDGIRWCVHVRDYLSHEGTYAGVQHFQYGN